jgi:hypothetical protein
MKHLRQITENSWHVIDTHTGKVVHTHNGIGFAGVETSKHAARLNNAEWNQSGTRDRYRAVTKDSSGYHEGKKAADWIDGNGNNKKKKTQPTKAASKPKSKSKSKSPINKKNVFKAIATYAAYKGLKHLLRKR